MQKRRLRQFQLFASGIFGFRQQYPAFFAHGFQASVQHGRGAEFAFPHQVFDRQAFLFLTRVGDDVEDAGIKRLQGGQGGHATHGFGELQEA